MKLKLILFGLILTIWNTAAQNQAEKLNFAGNEVVITTGYQAVSDHEATNGQFSVQWTNVPKIMYDKGVHKQMIKQIEDEQHARFISGIRFKSQGSEFTGKLYKLNVKDGIMFKILASGVINDRAVVLNLGFTKQPKKNSDIDEFMLHFISLE